jgi:hypothetical protein
MRNNAPPELLEAESQVREMNLRIDAQRQLIESLALDDHDVTSAKIVLDSLLTSLFLWVRERERLRSRVKVGTAETHAA